jgi:hypothetical protein
MSLQVEHRRVRLNTGVEDRRLAEEIYAAWKVEVARERWLGPRPSDQQFTVADLIDKYLALVTPRKAPDSQRRDRSVLADFIKRWGSLLIGDLTTDMIEEYLMTRLTHVTYGTASKELGILKAAYHAARRWGWVNVAIRGHQTESSRWESYSLAHLRGRASPSFPMPSVAS